MNKMTVYQSYRTCYKSAVKKKEKKEKKTDRCIQGTEVTIKVS